MMKIFLIFIGIQTTEKIPQNYITEKFKSFKIKKIKIQDDI